MILLLCSFCTAKVSTNSSMCRFAPYHSPPLTVPQFAENARCYAACIAFPKMPGHSSSLTMTEQAGQSVSSPLQESQVSIRLWYEQMIQVRSTRVISGAIAGMYQKSEMSFHLVCGHCLPVQCSNTGLKMRNTKYESIFISLASDLTLVLFTQIIWSSTSTPIT